MPTVLHHRALVVSVFWTLFLLLLGGVVHSTGSSLACPDWPTCYGQWMPEMTGGIFWEHLHRLVAGGLVLLFGVAVYLAWKEDPARPWIWKATAAGFGLLILQSVLGGITVILELPTLVSASHLSLALVFLSLATVLAVASSPRRGRISIADPVLRRRTRWSAAVLGVGVLLQSVLGGFVRHTGSGLACPDIPLCLGAVIPPLDQGPILLHWAHRMAGFLLALAVVAFSIWVLRRVEDRFLRFLAGGAGIAVLLQVALGFLSIQTFLAVIPVSLHTLIAGWLLALLVALASLTWEGRVEGVPEAEAPRSAEAAPS